MIRFFGLGICAASIACSGPAQAGPLSPKSVALQVVLPNTGPRVTQTYRVGEAILDLPLHWPAAATLGAAATIDLDGESAQLPAGTVLPFQPLSEADGSSIGAYCTPRRAAERATDSGFLAAPLFRMVLRPILRSATDRQLCLIDSDADGRADLGLVVGDGSPAARTPHPIAPVPLAIGEMVPSSGADRVRIVLTRVQSRGRWAEFEIRIEQQGGDRNFTDIAGQWGSSTKITRMMMDAQPPDGTSILGADFVILGVDPRARSVQIRWPDAADRSVLVAIPDALQIVYR